MVDLYKIMWAAEDNIVWNIKDETHDANCYIIKCLLEKYINVKSWAKNYQYHYHQWLENDSETVYNIHSKINAAMLDALREFNKWEKFRLYYWFDIDRTDADSFQWRNSPLSGEKLTELGPEFHFTNRYLSPSDFLVFPASDAL